MRVRDLMDASPVAAELPGERRDVLRLFSKHSLSGAPVVRRGTRELAGVVTLADLFRQPDEQALERLMASQPFTIAPDADAVEAARIFHHHRVHTLPVTEGAEVVGVVTPTRLLPLTRASAPVSQYVTKAVVPVHQDTTLPVAWTTMRLTGHNALPVLDDDARLVGIVADSDLFGEIPLAEQNGDALPRRPVRDVCVRAVVCVDEGDAADEAAQRMAKARVNQLPVTRGRGALAGIVTDLDLMRAWFP